MISYQSELKGILGTIELIHKINIKETIQICNNDAAVDIINRDLTPNDMVGLEVDIILAYQKQKHESDCQINLRWGRDTKKRT